MAASYGGTAMRLAKHLAHAGVASRRAAEQLDLRRPRHASAARSCATRPATSTAREPIAVDGRPVGAAEHDRARLHPSTSRAGVVSTVARHRTGRTTVVDLVKADRRLYPVGRLDADTHRPDPPDRRRRARPPPHAPVVRGAQDLPRRRAQPAGARAGAAQAARGRRARRRPHLARQGPPASPRASSRSPSTRAASARCGGCCEAVGHRVESLERVAFGPLRLGNLPAGGGTGELTRRRRSSGCAPLIECRRRCACYALRGATIGDRERRRRHPRAPPTS